MLILFSQRASVRSVTAMMALLMPFSPSIRLFSNPQSVVKICGQVTVHEEAE
jgi:hypothetical protein